MMEAIRSDKCIAIRPIGSKDDDRAVKLEVVQVSGEEEHVLEIAGSELLDSGLKIFHPLFTRPDTDFILRTINDSDYRICLEFSTHSSRSALKLVCNTGEPYNLHTLDETGPQRKLHFSGQHTPTGELYLMKFAKERGISEDEASRILSQIRVNMWREKKINIHIYSRDHGSFDVEIGEFESVWSLKDRICKLKDIPPGDQRLYHNNAKRELMGDEILADCELCDGSQVRLSVVKPFRIPNGKLTEDSARGVIIGEEEIVQEIPNRGFRRDEDFLVEPFILELCMHPRNMRGCIFSSV